MTSSTMASLLDSKSFVSLRGHVTKQRRPNARQFADYSRIEMSGESVGRQVLSADLRMNPVSANGEKFLHARRDGMIPLRHNKESLRNQQLSIDSTKRVRNQTEISRGKSSFFD